MHFDASESQRIPLQSAPGRALVAACACEGFASL